MYTKEEMLYDALVSCCKTYRKNIFSAAEYYLRTGQYQPGLQPPKRVAAVLTSLWHPESKSCDEQEVNMFDEDEFEDGYLYLDKDLPFFKVAVARLTAVRAQALKEIRAKMRAERDIASVV